MERITEIIENNPRASDEERFERILIIIEEYGMELIVSIILKQTFNYPNQESHEKNKAFMHSLPKIKRLILTEIMEEAFLNLNHTNQRILH